MEFLRSAGRLMPDSRLVGVIAPTCKCCLGKRIQCWFSKSPTAAGGGTFRGTTIDWARLGLSPTEKAHNNKTQLDVCRSKRTKTEKNLSKGVEHSIIRCSQSKYIYFLFVPLSLPSDGPIQQRFLSASIPQ